MADEESSKKSDEIVGAPAWVVTFADLMSLLMCFFVLLLAFSEMDVQKFKQLAGSMSEAFGVQREVRAYEIPKGTSIVTKEFSPAKPEPTALDQVRQKTSDDNPPQLAQPRAESSAEQREKTESDARQIAASLQREIREGYVEVETENEKIVIRVLEQGSFPSGTAQMNEEFLPVIKKISDSVAGVKGSVKISGHTDDLPIATTRFRSNWELSSARAVSVLHELLIANDKLDPRRFQIVGFADTRPRVPNDSKQNRAMNRRVELIIIQGEENGERSDAGEAVEMGLKDIAHGVSNMGVEGRGGVLPAVSNFAEQEAKRALGLPTRPKDEPSPSSRPLRKN